MNNRDLAKWFAAIVGAMLVLVGLLGFIDNPIVGEPHNNPIFVAGTVHNIVHIVTGAVALYIAFGLRGEQRANGLIAFGVLYAGVLLITLMSPDMLGLMEHPVNAADHGLHVALSLGSILVGWLARRGDAEVAVTR